MKTPNRSTKEEIKRKLLSLYSDSLDLRRNVLDFDKKYDFFSTNESLVVKFSSNWFWPEKYSLQTPSPHGLNNYRNLGQDDTGNQKMLGPAQKQESLLKIEKPVSSNNLTRDLEVLGKTPYQIGVNGEKFRVVAATLQKCSSPFIQRTFHFTSNGIVEAPEKKSESEYLSVIPFLKQTKAMVPPQKLVRIRRFRMIKKDEMAVEKYILPPKIKVANGEKTRFLTVRIRSKNSNIMGGERSSSVIKLEGPQTEIQRLGAATEKKEEVEENTNLAIQTEESQDVEQINQFTSDPETSSASLDPTEEEIEEKMEEVRQMKEKEEQKEDTDEAEENFKCENCGKRFLTYLSCLAHIRSHQRQVCQFCSKKFLTMKMLRDHIKMQHQHRNKLGTSEDRITTATSKFGRTRQVLNVAGLRSKYKML